MGDAGPTTTLDAVWPEVSVRLARRLRGLGLTRTTSEDVIQEVAVRALAAKPSFASADDLLRWAGVVARRLAIDEHRKRQLLDLESLSEAEERSPAPDVEAHALARLEFQAVCRALPKLSPHERLALTEVHPATDRTDQMRAAVLRHRARAHLARVIAGLSALTLVLGRVLRRAGSAVSVDPLQPLLTAAVATPLAVALLVAPGPATAPGTPPAAAVEQAAHAPAVAPAPVPAAAPPPESLAAPPDPQVAPAAEVPPTTAASAARPPPLVATPAPAPVATPELAPAPHPPTPALDSHAPALLALPPLAAPVAEVLATVPNALAPIVGGEPLAPLTVVGDAAPVVEEVVSALTAPVPSTKTLLTTVVGLLTPCSAPCEAAAP